MIELRHVTKRYGAVEALHDVSFRAPEGQIVGLLGQNGAGKSTTLRTIAGLVKPAPFAPMSVTISPSFTSKEIPLIAWIAP